MRIVSVTEVHLNGDPVILLKKKDDKHMISEYKSLKWNRNVAEVLPLESSLLLLRKLY